ncbi:MAG: hypothetical protein WC364_14310 [Eubacteriales bacterium]|jgi:hypothetical protein
MGNNVNLIDIFYLSGPPTPVKEQIQIRDGYWARRQTDGMIEKDPGDWLRASLPAAYGPNQNSRELALLISRLTLDWIF